MMEMSRLAPLKLLLQHLSDLWAFLWAFCSEDTDVEPPRPEPVPDACAEARLARLLQEAPGEEGDCGTSSAEPPAWLDAEKLARARRLHELYWPVISNAQVISLVLSFTMETTSRPLVLTGRSDTAERARRRYLETALHTLSWALGDVWRPDDTAFSNAERVRAMHAAVTRRLDGRSLQEVDLPAPPGGCPLSAIRADVGEPPAERTAAELAVAAGAAGGPPKFLSQTDMALTQWFFVGLIVLHPERFGLAHLTDHDLECFLHFWRSVGHRLGVSERHNLCAGSLSEVRALCLLVEQRVLVPQLRRPDRCWLGLTRALYDGLGLVFRQAHHDVFVYYVLHDVLGMEMAHLRAELGWLARLRHRLLRAIYRHANGNPEMHALIRARTRAQFVAGVSAEKLPKHLTYVLDII